MDEHQEMLDLLTHSPLFDASWRAEYLKLRATRDLPGLAAFCQRVVEKRRPLEALPPRKAD